MSKVQSNKGWKRGEEASVSRLNNHVRCVSVTKLARSEEGQDGGGTSQAVWVLQHIHTASDPSPLIRPNIPFLHHCFNDFGIQRGINQM